MVARLRRIPCVWHLRGLETPISKPWYRSLRLALVRLLPQRIIAVSEAVARGVAMTGAARRIDVVYNGVDLSGVRTALADSRQSARSRLGLPPARFAAFSTRSQSGPP